MVLCLWYVCYSFVFKLLHAILCFGMWFCPTDFVVQVCSPEDGISCSGHTPNTVWDNFKKKNSSLRTSLMANNPRGGRLSGDLDGNEASQSHLN